MRLLDVEVAARTDDRVAMPAQKFTGSALLTVKQQKLRNTNRLLSRVRAVNVSHSSMSRIYRLPHTLPSTFNARTHVDSCTPCGRLIRPSRCQNVHPLICHNQKNDNKHTNEVISHSPKV